MDKTDIRPIVKQIIVEKLGCVLDVDSIGDDNRLIEELGADSLDIIEITMACEDEYGIDIPVGDEDNFKTIGSSIKYIEQKLGYNE